MATPLQVHQVVCATEVQQRFDVAAARGLTPLVGREHEVGLLRDRWAQVQAGRGHIVLLSGEAGIGKSRLVQVVKDEIIGAATLRIEYRCAPYHQHSALYPVITHLERVLALRQDDTPEDKLRKLEEAVRPSLLPLVEVVPPFAALLSVPLPASYSPLDIDAPAAEAENSGSAADLAASAHGAAACPLYCRRSALDRSLDPGIPSPCWWSRGRRPDS